MTLARPLDELLAGNGRFCEGVSAHCDDRVELRLAQLEAQRPQVAVLSCADSRVDPDIVFDAPLGGVFSVRIAGALATEEAIASLRFAVDHLGVRTVVVLGHDDCGAVRAAVAGGPGPHDHGAPDELAPLLDPIRRALAERGGTDDPVRATTLAQAERVARRLGRGDGSPTVVAATYHPVTGAVEIHDDTPVAGAMLAPTSSTDTSSTDTERNHPR